MTVNIMRSAGSEGGQEGQRRAPLRRDGRFGRCCCCSYRLRYLPLEGMVVFFTRPSPWITHIAMEHTRKCSAVSVVAAARWGGRRSGAAGRVWAAPAAPVPALRPARPAPCLQKPTVVEPIAGALHQELVDKDDEDRGGHISSPADQVTCSSGRPGAGRAGGAFSEYCGCTAWGSAAGRVAAAPISFCLSEGTMTPNLCWQLVVASALRRVAGPPLLPRLRVARPNTWGCRPASSPC